MSHGNELLPGWQGVWGRRSDTLKMPFLKIGAPSLAVEEVLSLGSQRGPSGRGVS